MPPFHQNNTNKSIFLNPHHSKSSNYFHQRITKYNNIHLENNSQNKRNKIEQRSTRYFDNREKSLRSNIDETPNNSGNFFLKFLRKNQKTSSNIPLLGKTKSQFNNSRSIFNFRSAWDLITNSKLKNELDTLISKVNSISSIKHFSNLKKVHFFHS